MLAADKPATSTPGQAPSMQSCIATFDGMRTKRDDELLRRSRRFTVVEKDLEYSLLVTDRQSHGGTGAA